MLACALTCAESRPLLLSKGWPAAGSDICITSVARDAPIVGIMLRDGVDAQGSKAFQHDVLGLQLFLFLERACSF